MKQYREKPIRELVCPECNGSGQINDDVQDGFGYMECFLCEGTGIWGAPEDEKFRGRLDFSG